jgi:hypothetical protein
MFALALALKFQGMGTDVSILPLTSVLGGGGWSTPRFGCFTPTNCTRYTLVQETGWATRTVCKDAKNLAPTTSCSPDHPVRSGSLYRLSYRSCVSLTIQVSICKNNYKNTCTIIYGF